jgi:hypothetical protein
VGQWPKTPADKKKCSKPATNTAQFIVFEFNGAKKPTPEASKHSDPGATIVLF